MKLMKGCAVMFGVAFVAAVALAVGLSVFFNSRSDTHTVAVAPSGPPLVPAVSPPTPPPVVTPAAPPSPPLIPAPVIAAPAPIPAKPKPPTQISSATAQARLDAAIAAATARVDSSPKFVAQKNKLDALASDLQAARQGDDPQAKLDASSAWNSARVAYPRDRSAAINFDPAVGAARAAFDQASAVEAAARQVAQEAKNKADQDARRASEAQAAAEESERMKDPIYRAVKEKQVVVGMTEDQVIEAWGKPTATSRTVTSLGTGDEWMYGTNTGIFFYDGKVLSMTQTR